MEWSECLSGGFDFSQTVLIQGDPAFITSALPEGLYPLYDSFTF
jgi:hypothetical protein